MPYHSVGTQRKVYYNIYRDYKQGYELGRDYYDPLRAVIDKNTFSHAISFCRDPEKGLLWSVHGRDYIYIENISKGMIWPGFL